MLAFDDSIGPRVVCRDPNVPNTIPARQPVQRCNEGSAVVCDNFLDSTPSTQDLLENEVAKRVSSLSSKSTPFELCCEGTTGLDDIVEAASAKACGVDVGLSKWGCWSGSQLLFKLQASSLLRVEFAERCLRGPFVYHCAEEPSALSTSL